jgi:hypothetical protein
MRPRPITRTEAMVGATALSRPRRTEAADPWATAPARDS